MNSKQKRKRRHELFKKYGHEVLKIQVLRRFAGKGVTSDTEAALWAEREKRERRRRR